jgi:integrase
MGHKTFSEAMDEWLAHLKARGLEPGTIKAHRVPLRQALTFIGNIYVSNIKPEHIDKLFTHHGWAPRTRNLYLGQYRQFFAYCRRHNWMPKDYDPTETWRMLKVPNIEMPRIGIEDFPRLLEAATDPRDRAVCALGLYTFCRAGEIQSLRIRDIDFDRNVVSIYRHKTKEADELPLVSELAEEMVLWLNQYRAQQDRLEPDWFLVPSKGPLPMGWNYTLGRLAPTGEPARLRPMKHMSHPYRSSQRPLRAIGMEDKGVGGHVLRRSGARALFDRLRHEGYDGALKRVQSMLGHSNSIITERYLSLGVERLQRNEMLAGKPMFPDARKPGTLSELKVV